MTQSITESVNALLGKPASAKLAERQQAKPVKGKKLGEKRIPYHKTKAKQFSRTHQPKR